MSTVSRRTFVSTPARDSTKTWHAVVDLLAPGATHPARKELLDVVGIAASIISDRSPKDHAIVATCDGPRTRVYCLFDDDAVDGSDANEAALGYDALKGDWAVSLPCDPDELDWVQRALKKHSSRITARELNASVAADQDEPAAVTAQVSLVPDLKGLLES
ncbi:hypothetical protein A5906_26180 [Bradyrhizobium sacchari]|uniref:Uncharacterized protein n=1 Tax=Bradyrhizobium sacchari TaxID=1399419 RepID=A0A560JZD2_9BRAD|nr:MULTISPECIES: hypothetical protein [Bradyrhizobium]MCA1436814.1 hypothetical protein [Bradyrhizobium sp. BRP20]MCA1470728.1 hypothetical protein [Bradyrhizobium sp. IC3195]MCA1550867.1 hypothetical protein [Bradyrhizobium sp. BRP19]OPY99221.1 hypothetical protein A5906_26180 [Bradyrhizobium sacchari]TWB62971.1 hypothetical protein FBZ94_103671 [Bradyrhizobium sacchari]